MSDEEIIKNIIVRVVGEHINCVNYPNCKAKCLTTRHLLPSEIPQKNIDDAFMNLYHRKKRFTY